MRINILSGTKEVRSDAGVSMELRYYLVQDSVSGNAGKAAYGIGIVKLVEGEAEEQEWIPAISHSRERTERMLKRLWEGTVTPVTVVGIVDDLMGA